MKTEWEVATDLLCRAVRYYNGIYPNNRATYNDLEGLRLAVILYHADGFIHLLEHPYMHMIYNRINSCVPGKKNGYRLSRMMVERDYLEKRILYQAKKFNRKVGFGYKGICFWCLEEVDNLDDHSCDCLKKLMLCEVEK